MPRTNYIVHSKLNNLFIDICPRCCFWGKQRRGPFLRLEIGKCDSSRKNRRRLSLAVYLADYSRCVIYLQYIWAKSTLLEDLKNSICSYKGGKDSGAKYEE